MNYIKLLPDSVANQIAAGEVIQRPASVIKELVENAVDAGATVVQIVLKDAGRTLIQVIDNGCGMSETDARMAFERHATSKIRQATDLYTLHTMGFRGEALPSIAAVAQVDVRTMTANDTIGTRLVINGSRVESQEPEACSPGTNMMVKNLFFNIPVRRKFLKKDSVELANILREFERLALVNTGVEFTVIHNDVTLHRLLPAPLKRRIVDLFGKSLDRSLVALETDTSIARIDGYVGLPDAAKRRGALQYLTVNGRNMRHPYFHKAILQCYEHLIAPDAQPSYFLNFTVDPETIDVNIHPTKNEIKFENEQAIWQILTSAVREALSRAVPAIDFDRADAPDIPAFDPRSSAPAPGVTFDTSYNPFEQSRTTTPPPPRHNQAPVDWEKLYDDFAARRSQAVQEKVPTAGPSLIDEGDTAPIVTPQSPLQIKNRYIVAPAREGMIVIDQHRAHLNVLFSGYMARLSEGGFASQTILFPEQVELSPSQNAILLSILPELNSAGFSLTAVEGRDNLWSIEAVPAPLAHLNPVAPLIDIIDAAAEGGEAPAAEEVRRRVALGLARAAAIKPDQPLSTAEREQLLADLLSLPNPRYTPDGLLTMATITTDYLTELLSRLA